MPSKTSAKYYEAVGRRKTAIARVRLFPESKTAYEINQKSLETYFPVKEMQMTAMEAIEKAKPVEKFRISVKLEGGGIAAQADAMRHGIARALIIYDAELRGKVKKLGFLKRDPRAKERRKFGLKKARKSPQWSKR
ncbi:30S ribosomal protein S9 [Patescibacteria group bacterium]|nr:30S ribosomal protein S9 [Patescibacteria group bacterium]MDE1946505.1 30S ribosomal protein S9 [Patescibacteria group bacterium]MDE2011250.1 30S ribosomal protein S9 [Patescibacteria group bacterium]MDE2233333.1 30S ribosomal protein S9 [Patescibacteria group bacterium]